MAYRKISFHYQTRNFTFRDRERAKSFLLRLFRMEGIALEKLDYIFCTDTYLLEINQEFLRHETLTDVITFQYSQDGTPIRSEVYISIERVRDNAVQFGSPLSQELLRIMIHGALHLCGYKDKTPRAKKAMTQKEDEYLRLYLVSRGTN